MINRLLSEQIREASKNFPIVSLMGPRQSGKTTLSRLSFPDYEYISLENPDIRAFADEDPRGFLSRYSSRVILDEVQRVPNLFSYLQGKVDEAGEPGQYVLTGSHNFLLLEKIGQSLAGRVALYKLLPLSIAELKEASQLPACPYEWIFKGAYPRLYERSLPPVAWYPNYITTYLERDVRQIINVSSLSSFQRFLHLCAGRCGQILNYSDIAVDCGISAIRRSRGSRYWKRVSLYFCCGLIFVTLTSVSLNLPSFIFMIRD